MALNIPMAINLGDFPAAVPNITFQEPREGRKMVTLPIDWQIPLAAGVNAVNVNLQNNATLEFSQICGLVVDNSDCGSDLDFIFPDTEVTVSIPAYAPYTVLDTFTNQTQLYIRANDAIDGDFTRFSLLNYAPPPVAVPLTLLQQNAAIAGIAIDGASTDAIIPAGENGTLQSISVNVAQPNVAAPFNDNFQLIDGTGKIVWSGNFALDTGPGWSGTLIDLSNLNIRFVDGIELVQTGGATPGGTIGVNLYYKVP